MTDELKPKKMRLTKQIRAYQESVLKLYALESELTPSVTLCDALAVKLMEERRINAAYAMELVKESTKPITVCLGEFRQGKRNFFNAK